MHRSRIVIFASSRSRGDTRTLLEKAMEGVKHDFVDLSELQISPFDYEHRNRDDDFIGLMEKITGYDDLILASPVYWYAVSATMKVFIDRWSDLLTVRKDLGNKLAGKNLYVISSYGTEFPPGGAFFSRPLEMTCDYMNMNFRGVLCLLAGEKEAEAKKQVEDFRAALLSDTPDICEIKGKRISLRLATLADREALYQWFSEKAVSALSPEEQPRKTWGEFKASWEPFYFQKPLSSRGHVLIIKRDEVDVGGVVFYRPDQRNRARLEIWLSSEKNRGGTGEEAVSLLCSYLYRQMGIVFFWAMPSPRDTAAVAVFRRAGFKSLPLTPGEGLEEFGFRDYHDSVYLLKDMSLGD